MFHKLPFFKTYVSRQRWLLIYPDIIWVQASAPKRVLWINSRSGSFHTIGNRKSMEIYNKAHGRENDSMDEWWRLNWFLDRFSVQMVSKWVRLSFDGIIYHSVSDWVSGWVNVEFNLFGFEWFEDWWDNWLSQLQRIRSADLQAFCRRFSIIAISLQHTLSPCRVCRIAKFPKIHFESSSHLQQCVSAVLVTSAICERGRKRWSLGGLKCNTKSRHCLNWKSWRWIWVETSRVFVPSIRMPKKADSVSAKRTRNLSFTCLTSLKCCHPSW